MQLEKALKKAKQQRLLRSGYVQTGLPGEKTLGRGKWQAPVYNQSRYMDLDDDRAMANRCVCLRSNTPVMDEYKVLRTQLIQRMQPRGWNTVMVTSIRPGEGKTLTSINLALTFSKAYNHTVLLVDCDLRQQSVYRHLGLASEKGMVNYLMDGCPLSELIIWPQVEKLTLISGGRTIADSAELLGSQRMREVLSEMKHRYSDRYVVVDAPPLLVGADTLTLAPMVDGIVLVVESGGPPLKEIQEALELIPKEKFLGFVLNKHSTIRNRYYRYYRPHGED